MKIERVLTLSQKQKERLLELWNAEYPTTLNHPDLKKFESYIESLSQASHLLLTDQDNILGWYVDFIRLNEKWFAMILDKSIHGKGYGSQFLAEAKTRETSLSGWVIDHNNDKKVDGSPYLSPLDFYLKNGFSVISGTRLELDKISAVKIIWENTCLNQKD